MRAFWLTLPLSLLCAAQLRADTVTLNDGTKIDGTIKAETPTEVVIDMQVSSSITDERVIQKDQIAKIDKEQPDQIAYDQLVQTQPNPEMSYTSQRYSQIISALNDFQTSYPFSSYLPEIKKLAATFEDEKKRVDSGELKYMGQWLSKDEAARRRIQIQGFEAYNTMQQQAAAGDLVGAMDSFDTIEHQYGTTRAYPAAIQLAEQILARLQQDLVVRMEAVKSDQAQLKNTIAFTAEPQKSEIINDAKIEQDRGNEAVTSALRSGKKWVPLIPRNQLSIDTLQKTAASEITRMGTLTVAAMTQSIAKSDAARTALLGGDAKTAEALLKDAVQLWSTNEDAHYLEQKVTAATAPTPTPAPAAAATPVTLKGLQRPSPQLGTAVTNESAPAPADKPFYMTITGAITIAVLILVLGGGVAAYNQKKSRQAPAAE